MSKRIRVLKNCKFFEVKEQTDDFATIKLLTVEPAGLGRKEVLDLFQKLWDEYGLLALYRGPYTSIFVVQKLIRE